MANICSFEMHIRGNDEDIEKFVKAMNQEGEEYWMGRGAGFEIERREEGFAIISGTTKWSLEASLINNAHSMEHQRVTGEGNWYWQDRIKDVKEFIDLFKACEKFHVNMEAYSKEEGCQFQEHMKYENGEITNESCSWEVEYDEENYEIIREDGGYEWDFDVAEVDVELIEQSIAENAEVER